MTWGKDSLLSLCGKEFVGGGYGTDLLFEVNSGYLGDSGVEFNCHRCF